MSKDGSVRVTFKMDEDDIKNFINKKSSPAAYLKDLIREDMEKSNLTNVTTSNTMIPTNMFDLID